MKIDMKNSPEQQLKEAKRTHKYGYCDCKEYIELLEKQVRELKRKNKELESRPTLKITKRTRPEFYIEEEE